MKTIFETKEAYLNFKQNWKKFIKEGKHKKYKASYLVGYRYKRVGIWPFYRIKSIHEYGHYWKSDLTATHHLIYGIATNVKINKMFKPLCSDMYASEHFYGASVIAMNNVAKFDLSIDKVFGDTITKEQINKIYDYIKLVYEKTNKFTEMEKENSIDL